jgi:hypothetical protein
MVKAIARRRIGDLGAGDFGDGFVICGFASSTLEGMDEGADSVWCRGSACSRTRFLSSWGWLSEVEGGSLMRLISSSTSANSAKTSESAYILILSTACLLEIVSSSSSSISSSSNMMSSLRPITSLRTGLIPLMGLRGGVLSSGVPDGCMNTAAATCSSSFCRTRVLLFSAWSSLETQSSMELSSSASASSCLRIESWENLAVLGERR